MDQKVSHCRQLFPAVLSKSYLNTGTCGPLPDVCTQAMQLAMQTELEEGRASIPGYIAFFNRLEEVRTMVAEGLHASPDEIVMTHHTTEGMNIVLWGLDWQAGDEIITSTLEHMGLLAPLALLHAQRGVRVRYLPLNGDAEHDTTLLKQAITPQTRMVALSHVEYLYGTRFPIEAIAPICEAAGVPLLVDGAQSVGVFPVDVTALGAAFYAFPFQKWLCGPEGTGGLYIRKDWQSRIRPTQTGTFSIRDVAWFDQTSPYFVPAVGARRYQHGGLFRPIIEGLAASLRCLQEIGMEWIYERIASSTRDVHARLSACPGISVLSPFRHLTSLITFEVEGFEARQVSALLEEKGVQIRYVPVGDGTFLCRASIGFYNNEDDFSRLIAALHELAESTSA